MLVLSGILVLLGLVLLVVGIGPGSFSLVYLSIFVGALAAAAVTIGVLQHRDNAPHPDVDDSPGREGQ